MDFLEMYVEQQFETHRASLMFHASAEAGRWDLARKITEEMIKRDGGLVYNWSMTLLDEAEKRGNLGLALSVCDEMLENTPDNTSLVKRRKRIVRQISSQGS